MRKELDIEINDINSALFSEGLISESVLDKKNIETTLKAVREALENESVAEKTFEGFTNVLRDITSKGHLAQAMLDKLQDKLKGERVYVRSTGQVGSSVVTPYSTTGQFGGAMLSKSHTEFGISSQKMPESATDSALSVEEDFTFTPQQPTCDRESTDRNHGVAPEASGTLPLRVFEAQESAELEEMIKRAKQGKRTREDMIDRRDEEIKQLHSLCKEKDEKLDEVQLQLLSNKKHYIRQIETAEEKKRQAEKKANMEKEKAGKLQQEIEQAKEKARELAKKLEETEEETRQYKQEAAEHKKRAEQKEEEVQQAEEKVAKLQQKLKEKEESAQKHMEEFEFCTELAKQNDEKVSQLLKKIIENEEL